MNQVRTTLRNNPDLAREVMDRGLTSAKDTHALDMLGLFGDRATVHRMAVAVADAGGVDRWTVQSLAQGLNASQGVDDARPARSAPS